MASSKIFGVQSTDGGLYLLTALLPLPFGIHAHCLLYKDSFTPTKDSKLADFIANEADFNGYSQAGATLSPPTVNVDGQVTCWSFSTQFIATDDLVPNNINGVCWTVVTSVGPPMVQELYGYFQFPTPIAMAVANASIMITGTIDSNTMVGWLDLEY